MKIQFTQQLKVRVALFLVATALGVNALYAQGTAYTTLAAHPNVVAPKSLAVAVYQVENSLKFKVHFENYAGDDVVLRIKDGRNKVIYEEKVKNTKKYVRKFDLSMMADDEYKFEVANKHESFSKQISLETLSARTLHIDK